MWLSFIVRDRISVEFGVRQRGVGIDERQRDLAVERGVQRMPELQVRRTAVEHQQPVAPAGDGGAGNEVDVVLAVAASIGGSFGMPSDSGSRVGSPP